MTYRVLGILAILGVVACRQESLPERDSMQDGERCVLLKVNDAQWTEESAKTVYTPGSGVALSGTEMLSLIYEKDKLYDSDIKASPTAQAGIYSFSMPSAAQGASRWYGIMPYSSWLNRLNASGTAVKLRLGPVQFPQPDSFDPQFDYLVAKPFSVNGSTAEIVAFKRLFAPLCLSVSGLPDGAKIYTLTLSLSQEPGEKTSLTGLYYLTLSESCNITHITHVDASSKGNAVSAEYGDGLQAKNGSYPVWFMVNPITLNAGSLLTVSLSTQDRTYTRTVSLPSSQTLDKNRLNRISFDMSGSGSESRSSITQDFANKELGGTKTLPASNGVSLEWVTTATREFRASDDGGSAVKGALMLNGNSFTFPQIAGKRIVGARIFTHPSSTDGVERSATLTVDGTDVYKFNLACNNTSESLSWSGGVIDISIPQGKKSLSGLTVSASESRLLISAITLFTEDDSYDPSAEDFAVDRSLFELLNLDYPGFTEIRQLYYSGRYKMAADALLAYYKARPGIVNPSVTLPVTSVASSIRKIADDALPENKYRFAVHAGMYYESYSGGQYTYWSFDDGSGHINWEYEMPESGTQCFQKHWHYWFLPMAQMFRYTGNEKYFNEWKAQYSDWMEHYPCPTRDNQYTRNYGYNSWYALSMATRIDYQTQLFEYFISADGFDFQWLTTFLKAFCEMVEYSRTHLYYNEESNIRFAQYKSHCLAGMLFPEFKLAPVWLSVAAGQVSNYFDTSFSGDGVLIELDANYHSGEVMNYVAVYEAAQKNGRLDCFPSDFLDKLNAACHFIADYCYPDGRWEIFNDTRQQTANVTRRWLRTFAALYPDDSKFLYLSSGGSSGVKPQDRLREYRTSGYYMFRSDWASSGMMLIYKNNYNPKNMWHAHRDNGTVGFYNNGRIFLPAPGAYTYGDGEGGSLDQARAEHQAARNHNTLTCELADIGTANSLGRYLTSFDTASRTCVVAENDSYDGLTHRRTVWMVGKKFFVIADAAYGNAADKNVNLSWHLCRDNSSSAGADVAVLDPDLSNYAYGAHTTFSDGNNLLMKTFAETTSGFSAHSGLSWCSEVFGERYQRKFYRVNVQKESSASVPRFITVLYPCANPSSVSVSAAFAGEFSTSGETVRVTINGTTYVLSYSL